jgi:hypothetical protein
MEGQAAWRGKEKVKKKKTPINFAGQAFGRQYSLGAEVTYYNTTRVEYYIAYKLYLMLSQLMEHHGLDKFDSKISIMKEKETPYTPPCHIATVEKQPRLSHFSLS